MQRIVKVTIRILYKEIMVVVGVQGKNRNKLRACQYQTDNLNATMPSEVGKTISLSLSLSASMSTVVVESTHVLLYKSNIL